MSTAKVNGKGNGKGEMMMAATMDDRAWMAATPTGKKIIGEHDKAKAEFRNHAADRLRKIGSELEKIDAERDAPNPAAAAQRADAEKAVVDAREKARLLIADAMERYRLTVLETSEATAALDKRQRDLEWERAELKDQLAGLD